MGRGGKRLGSGRRPKTLAQLEQSGTFRRDRHSHLLKVVPPPGAIAVARADAQDLPLWATADLGVSGTRFIVARWKEAIFTGADLELLRQVARSLDDCESAGNPRDRRAALRLFAQLLEQLGA
jgi:hypothetical protein